MHTFLNPFPTMTISDILNKYRDSPYAYAAPAYDWSSHVESLLPLNPSLLKHYPLRTNHPPITEQSIRCQIVTPKRKKKPDVNRNLHDMPQRTRDQPELHSMPGLQSQLVSIADLARATAAYSGIDRIAFSPARRCGRRYLEEITRDPAGLTDGPGEHGNRGDQEGAQDQVVIVVPQFNPPVEFIPCPSSSQFDPSTNSPRAPSTSPIPSASSARELGSE